jgi:hypothetical protein
MARGRRRNQRNKPIEAEKYVQNVKYLDPTALRRIQF